MFRPSFRLEKNSHSSQVMVHFTIHLQVTSLQNVYTGGQLSSTYAQFWVLPLDTLLAPSARVMNTTFWINRPDGFSLHGVILSFKCNGKEEKNNVLYQLKISY